MRTLALTGAVLALASSASARQVRVSPGPLAAAHTSLEGVTTCGRCHEAGRGLSEAKCLGCHAAIASRIAARKGVHRAVTTSCTPCHREHGGVDADLRHLDVQAFNHLAETGFALDGQHAKVAATCKACHKKRSFIAARPACQSCHADPHKGSLGDTCTRCHPTDVPFKEARRQFNHASARFDLTGAHRIVACEKCHVAGVFQGLRFDVCSACHKPHRAALGPACQSCHVTERWAAVSTFEHARSGFTLAGAHVRVACAKCHPSGVTRPLEFNRCSSCHGTPHRENFADDCRACHKETAFRPATFDHAVRAAFPLAGKHDGLRCRKCHTSVSADEVPLARKVVDFKGLSGACDACHKDQHKGEYGRRCEVCHLTATFKAAGFVHPRSPEFFGGRHTGVTCVRCHVRTTELSQARAPAPKAAQATPPSTRCTTCHADVHLGQVGPVCERCHTVDAARFAAARFSHDAGAFPLIGKHRPLECAKCHLSETATFPAGLGTARRLSPVSRDCRSCHKDPHLGQADPACTPCHSPVTFRMPTYPHPGQEYTFGVGNHDRLPCKSCHKVETGVFPAGRGTAMRLKVGRTCIDCHPKRP